MVRALLLSMFLLSGCVTIGTSPTGDAAVWCKTNKQVHRTEAEIDAMSDAEVNRALAILEKGEKLCGWKKRK